MAHPPGSRALFRVLLRVGIAAVALVALANAFLALLFPLELEFREGTSWLFKILSRIEAGRGAWADLDLLLSLSGEVSGKVLCALGDFATSPVVATVKQYRDEYEQHIRTGGCPFEAW